MEQQHPLAPQADQLIKSYAFRSSLAGFIPIPLLDTLGLIGVQRLMLFRLSGLYGIPFSKNLAKAWLTTLMSGVASTAATPMLGSTLLKFIPGIGSLAGSTGMAALGSASTYAVGKVFQQHFENGGTLENFNPVAAKDTFAVELEHGKEISRPEPHQ
ncbi:YcjF family protein [Thiothrix lacustris]|uniref:YcjF family protein n=1 Tax=Thiothrix lacustris TaxID=525917 RepID=UPI0027E461F9|nr:DUF697 domain-containing protein [Thiothrix lacustris]WMP19420.1 DUF697 domain-containing protein [Thiothrix lacustris]